MTRRNLLCTLLLSMCAVAGPAQTAHPKVIQNGRNIQINVVVMASKGTVVLNLQKQDFAVRDSGVVCPIKSVQLLIPSATASAKPQASASAVPSTGQSQAIPMYQLVYVRPASAAKGSFRQIEVLVGRPNLSVKSPKGYKVSP